MEETEVGALALSLVDFKNRPRANEAPECKLERMLFLLKEMGNPQTKIGTVVHISGSSGKGSTSTLTAAGLASQLSDGSKVGLFTSPHLTHITERIRIVHSAGGGEARFVPISESDFASVEREVWPYIEAFNGNSHEGDQKGRVGFFECMTLMAMVYFSQQGVDASVIEVGMGGRYDATNMLPSRVVAVTPIGLDHIAALGGSLSSIAHHKART